jgi:nucleoside-diphosphate-sugar epimerase
MNNKIRILLSGSNGFVGKSIIKYLNKLNNNIIIIKLSRSFNDDSSISWEDLDNTIPECDIYIHLAGIAHDLKHNINATDYYSVNVGLTKKLFDIFLKSKAKKFIYFSSVKVLGDDCNKILDENSKLNPKTIYAKTKLLAENYLNNKYNCILHENLYNKKLIILRPCMIYGNGNKGNLNILFNFFKKGYPYIFTNFKNKRSYLSITNLNYILENIIYSNIKSGTYLLSDDQFVSTYELVEMSEIILNKKIVCLKFPKFIIFTLAYLGNIFNLSFNTNSLKKITKNCMVSNKKIKSELNINLPINSYDGLKLVLAHLNSIN